MLGTHPDRAVKGVLAFCYGKDYDGHDRYTTDAGTLHALLGPVQPNTKGAEYLEYLSDLYVAASNYKVQKLSTRITRDFPALLATFDDTHELAIIHLNRIARHVFLKHGKAAEELHRAIIERFTKYLAAFPKTNFQETTNFHQLLVAVPELSAKLVQAFHEERRSAGGAYSTRPNAAAQAFQYNPNRSTVGLFGQSSESPNMFGGLFGSYNPSRSLQGFVPQSTPATENNSMPAQMSNTLAKRPSTPARIAQSGSAFGDSISAQTGFGAAGRSQSPFGAAQRLPAADGVATPVRVPSIHGQRSSVSVSVPHSSPAFGSSVGVQKLDGAKRFLQSLPATGSNATPVKTPSELAKPPYLSASIPQTGNPFSSFTFGSSVCAEISPNTSVPSQSSIFSSQITRATVDRASPKPTPIIPAKRPAPAFTPRPILKIDPSSIPNSKQK